MATRDQWYKPNLLYNIHYKPPIKVEPPKLIVQTSLFNPSVCTCGEHGCEQKYRMERKVLWSIKERDAVKQEHKTGEEQKIIEVKDLEDKSNIRNCKGSGDMERGGASVNKDQRAQEKEGTKDNVNRSLQSSVDVQEYGVSDDGNVYTAGVRRRSNVRGVFGDGVIKTDSVGRRNNDDGSVRGDNKIDFGYGKINIDGVVTRRNNDKNVRDEGGICIEKGFTEVFRSKLSDDGSTRSDDRGDVGRTCVRNHDMCVCIAEEDGSTGIDDRNIDIDRVGIHNNHDDGGGVASQKKDGGATIVHCNENTEDEHVCQDEDVETEELDEEISSAFGIMSVYCNSELHSWGLLEQLLVLCDNVNTEGSLSGSNKRRQIYVSSMNLIVNLELQCIAVYSYRFKQYVQVLIGILDSKEDEVRLQSLGLLHSACKVGWEYKTVAGTKLRLVKNYPDERDLHRKVTAVLVNVSENSSLVKKLMRTDLLTVLRKLLSYKSEDDDDVIDVGSIAVDCLIMLASHSPEAWTVADPSRDVVLEEIDQVMKNWNMYTTKYRDVEKNDVGSFTALLSQIENYSTPVAQIWAAWKICHLIMEKPHHYSCLLESESGFTKIDTVLQHGGLRDELVSLLQKIKSLTTEYNEQSRKISVETGGI